MFLVWSTDFDFEIQNNRWTRPMLTLSMVWKKKLA